MSYSYTVRAASKAEAKTAVAAELVRVLEQQPIHHHDLPAAQATAEAFIDILPDDDTQDVLVSGHGSVSGRWANSELELLTSASMGVNAGLAAKILAS